ncbi:MAG: VIT domain-containing protein [Planctomycetota bacterium]
MPRPSRACLTLRAAAITGLVAIWAVTPAAAQGRTSSPANDAKSIPGGQLQILGENPPAAGLCPLKGTDVTADIAGFLARVTVRQTFHNPADRKIEAVYVFPLPQDAAVDDMVMTVGDRRIVGQIKQREEARAIYEAAKAAGHVASLLDQERPNIFTQSVANIEPGAAVVIEIRYVETLRFDEGVFEWVFPMVVGPRYIPGGGSAPAPMTTGQDTPEVPDGSKITPPVTPKGTRAGHDIRLTVNLDAGMPIADLKSELHEIAVQRDGDARASVTLKNADEIPNRDFVLRYRLGAESIADAFLVHEDTRGKFFTLILQPPQRVAPAQLVARELIFVLDTSGSMGGLPIERAKEVMAKLIDTMQPADTFNLITFSGHTRILWPAPRPNTPQNRAELQQLLASQHGSGGTEMMKAINAALAPTASAAGAQRPSIRIVCFFTDGYVGNDMAIIDAVKKHAGTSRVFSFGVGNSVNRFLLDNMAHAGRGEVEYVSLESEADAAVNRFHVRVLAPVLTDVQIDWGTLPVADVYPAVIPDLFSAKPVLVHGRLTGTANGTIVLRGNTGAGPYEDTIAVNWPQSVPDHAALPSLWARAKVGELMMQDYAGLQNGTMKDELKRAITGLGLEFRLVTQFTSFVAVEQVTVTVGGEPTRVDVPVEIPSGVSYEGVFCDEFTAGVPIMRARLARASPGMAGGRGAPPAPCATPPPQTGVLTVTEGMGAERAAGKAFAFDQSAATQPTLTPEQAAEAKLAEPLRGLAAKVVKEGRAGDLTVGKLKVQKYRVDVIVMLRDASEQTLAALAQLGFERTGESKAVTLLIGTIDVRKLEELAKLKAVLRVRPVVE